MTRLAMYCNEDKEQLLRVFKSSGQFREEKPNSYYDLMAEQSIKFISDIKTTDRTKAPPMHTEQKGSRVGANAKG